MKIIVICTGNSCRSQMAEAFLREYIKDGDIYSAGIEAHGINPYMSQVMSEMGYDLKNHQSNTIDKYLNESFDIVITVCDHAHKTCPVFKFVTKHIHHNFFDPANAVGTNEEKLDVYRKVRNEIEAFIKEFSSDVNAIISEN